MKLVTLGAPRLDGPDAPPSSARRKQLALLTYLARQENREATRSQLADLLWEDGDRARARHSLRQAISGLRPLLGDLLTTEGQHVRLSGELPLDLAELERHHPDDAGSGPTPAPAEEEFLAGFDDVGGERWRSWLRRERDAVRRRFRWRTGPGVNRAKRAAPQREERALADALDGAWEDIASGGALVVDAPADETRAALCEQFTSARAADGELLAAEASGPVVRPWAYLGRLCARLPELQGLTGAPASALAALRRFSPGLAERFPRLPLQSSFWRDPAAALAETLAAAATSVPVTVVAADFDRADHQSREVISQLVRARPTNVAFVLIGSSRDVDAGADLRALARLPGVRTLRLGAATVPPVPEPVAAEALPPASALGNRLNTADRLLLAAGGIIAAVVLVLAVLAMR
jgi:hypothetical protein